MYHRNFNLMSALALASFLLTAVPVHGGTLLVPTDYPTIQVALDAALNGDEVVVEPGTYYESVVVPPIGVILRSQSSNPSNTILDGTGNAAEPAMVYFEGSTGRTRAIRGFTLTNSETHAIDIDDLAVPRGHHGVTNCRFINNGPKTALDGGFGSINIAHCEFIDNEGLFDGGAVVVHGPATIHDNLFRNNTAIPTGSHVFTSGGAIYLHNYNSLGTGTVSIRNNAFEDNSCTDYGGAIYVNEDNATIENNTFLRNVADICAGAIYMITKGNNVVRGNLFVGNSSPVGATIGVDLTSEIEVSGNTVVNSLGGGAGILVHNSTNVLVRANIVAFGETWGIRWWATDGEQVSGTQECNDAFGHPAGNYEGMLPGSTNLSVDPLFCDPANQDYSLNSGSQCLAANNSCNALIGAFPQGCSIDYALDIRPNGCPNPFNVTLFDWAQENGNPMKGGVLPVAILGTHGFDVADIETSTIRLVGVAPLPFGSSIEDVSTASEFEDCQCSEAGADGIDDLTLKFNAQAVAAAIGEGVVGDEYVMTLEFETIDGTPYEVQDCVTFRGQRETTPLEQEGAGDGPFLGSAYPNPFNPVTTISYRVPSETRVRLSIYNVRGELVETLVDGVVGAGEHTALWDARLAASGTYFYQLRAGDYTETRKAILLK